jgi:hypothetical protein
MSKTQDPKEFKVTIIVTDEQGNELQRKVDYKVGRNFSSAVEDLVDSFLEAENL